MVQAGKFKAIKLEYKRITTGPQAGGEALLVWKSNITIGIHRMRSIS